MRVRLFIWLILCIVCLHTPLSAQSPLETPSSMVLAATQAADGDSILLVKRRWQARVQTNVGDHLATLGIATLDRLSYNYPDAERRYAALATATDVSGTIRAYAILGDALAADTRGLLARADSLFPQARSAARLAGDSLVEAEALLGWAFSRAPVAGIAAGFALLDSASKLIPDSARGLRAEYLMRRGALRAVTAQGGGEDDARMSRNIARQIGAARLEARAIRTLALDAKLRGNDLRAIALLDTAAAIQRRVHDRSGLAETLLRQRESYIARMDLGKVKQLSFEAAEEARISYNAIAFRSVLLGLGTLSLYLRDYPSADAYLSRVIDLCRAEEDTTMMMLARSQRVDLYLSVGDVARALEEKNAVLNYHHNFGDRSEEFETLRELIAIHLQSGDIASATQTLQRAEQLARRQPRWLATLHFDRGAIALARKDWRAADQHFAGALAELDSTEHLQRYVALPRQYFRAV